MERDDLPTLRGMGFEDDELREMGLWEPAVGPPASLAEVYIRRSKKKDTLSSLREQVRRICQQALRDDTQVRRVWFEQRSASKAYVRREEFERATAAVCDGLSGTLYVFKTSRLSRRGMGQVGLLLDRFEEQGARIYVVSEALDSRRSRMILAILSEQAREQAADIAEFTAIGIAGNKADGRFTGGVTPYGLRAVDGRLEPDPDEYPTARRIAAYLLRRRTPGWIAALLNAEGLRSRHGKHWSASGIISLAHSVTWAGLVAQREKIRDERGRETDRYHRGGVPLLGKDGQPVSLGQGVISFAQHVKINAILASRSRPGTSIGDRTRGKREIVSLLTETLRCPYCGGAMANGGVNYRCYSRQMGGAAVCKGVSTERKRVDAAVEIMWLNRVLNLSPESATLHALARGWLAYQDPAAQARKEQATASLESAVGRELKLRKEYFVLARLSEADYEYLRRSLDAQIAALKAELAELEREADLTPLMDPEALAALWSSEGIGGQRALLSAAVRSITLIPPAGRGDRTPIMRRLAPDWRD